MTLDENLTNHLLEIDDFDLFMSELKKANSGVYPKISQLDIKLIKHWEFLGCKQGKERGEDIMIPNQPRMKKR